MGYCPSPLRRRGEWKLEGVGTKDFTMGWDLGQAAHLHSSQRARIHWGLRSGVPEGVGGRQPAGWASPLPPMVCVSTSWS